MEIFSIALGTNKQLAEQLRSIVIRALCFLVLQFPYYTACMGAATRKRDRASTTSKTSQSKRYRLEFVSTPTVSRYIEPTPEERAKELCTKYQRSLLHAAEEGHIKVIERIAERLTRQEFGLLVKHAKTSHDDTAVHLALEADPCDTLKAIMSQLSLDDAYVLMQRITAQGYTPLLSAIYWGHSETLAYWEEYFGRAYVIHLIKNQRTSRGHTALHIAAECAEKEVLQVLHALLGHELFDQLANKQTHKGYTAHGLANRFHNGSLRAWLTPKPVKKGES